MSLETGALQSFLNQQMFLESLCFFMETNSPHLTTSEHCAESPIALFCFPLHPFVTQCQARFRLGTGVPDTCQLGLSIAEGIREIVQEFEERQSRAIVQPVGHLP